MSTRKLAALCSAVFLLSALFFWQSGGTKPSFSLRIGGEELGRLCISQAYPTITKGVAKNEEISIAEPAKVQREEKTKNLGEPGEGKEPEKPKGEKPERKADNGRPDVIIYHTHSSESYQPYTASNFHTEKVDGSVREVGNVMAKELRSLGIGTVHDMTVHDRPSYNESYDRSLETIVALQKKYPTAKYIIDLHRDAAAYSGNKGKTIDIDGETTATYGLVVGQNNANYQSLMNHAKKVNDAAEKRYPGFGGRIIEKTYRYNEYIADKYLLLEVGNNQNRIEQVRATGKYFARVLADVINEEK